MAGTEHTRVILQWTELTPSNPPAKNWQSPTTNVVDAGDTAPGSGPNRWAVGFHTRQLEDPFLQAFVPQGIAVAVPVQRLKPVACSRAEEEQVPAQPN